MKIIALALLMLVLQLMDYPKKQTYSFSLEKLIAFALENNYSAITCDRDLLDAKKQKWKQLPRLPQIDGAVSYQNQFKNRSPVCQVNWRARSRRTFIPVVCWTTPNCQCPRRTLNNKFLTGQYLVGIQAQKPYCLIVIKQGEN